MSRARLSLRGEMSRPECVCSASHPTETHVPLYDDPIFDALGFSNLGEVALAMIPSGERPTYPLLQQPWHKAVGVGDTLLSRISGSKVRKQRLRQYTRRLREKIERNPDLSELITAHWGEGYRFETLDAT